MTTTLGSERKKKIKVAKGDASKARHDPPEWISKENWNELFNYWTSTEWKKRSVANKQNRLSTKNGGISKHCEGSINFVNHDERLLLKLGRKPTQIELSDRTHKKDGGKGGYVDDRSRVVMTTYQTELAKKNVDASSSNVVQDYFNLWLDATGGPSHGHVYGRSRLENLTGITRQSSFSSIGASEFTELYTREDFLRKLDEEKKKWQDEMLERMGEEFGPIPRHANQGNNIDSEFEDHESL